MSNEVTVEELRLKAVMSTYDGRAWVYDLLTHCGVFTSSYVNNSLDMSFNEGMRNVGLRIMAELTAYTFTEYHQMENEARKRKLEREAKENYEPDEFD